MVECCRLKQGGEVVWRVKGSQVGEEGVFDWFWGSKGQNICFIINV